MKDRQFICRSAADVVMPTAAVAQGAGLTVR
jgi:hypothetical protein